MANVDEHEKEKFNSKAIDWWDKNGPLKTLHDINPCRLEYIKSHLELRDASACDIGCGGGILSSELARQGSHVTAIDAAPKLIEIAELYATEHHLDIEYKVGLSSNLIKTHSSKFDLVTCMELIEHVPDPLALVEDCAKLLSPGGVLIISTLNRNLISYALGVLAAEYLLGLIPKGTHEYTKFLKPSELAKLARQTGLETLDISGMYYNPLTRHASIGAPPVINYVASFQKPFLHA
jgi:2-polyprenyl-6-hydroxyphenyl methylase/3-demethylubiquinone-9 3-methyltransferase